MTALLEKTICRIGYSSYNLVTQESTPGSSYLAAQFGSCANSGRWDTLPMGIDVRLSTKQFEESTEECESLKVHQKSFDVGGGNFLNFRWVEKPVGSRVEKVGIREVLPEPPPPNREKAPAVWCGYFEELYNCLQYGWHTPEQWSRKHDAALDKQFLEELNAAVKGTTVVWLIASYQINYFKSTMERFGWKDNLLFESDWFHNRSHADTGNTLKFFVYQFKD